VSVVALKALLSNMTIGDPPVIVTCQTNHALDQLLRHIAQFEPNFVRLGGRSKDQDVIRKRTLFEVRQATSKPPVGGGGAKIASRDDVRERKHTPSRNYTITKYSRFRPWSCL
jgi:helicase required for RNAi-mediated heterochromatin assembly 1